MAAYTLKEQSIEAVKLRNTTETKLDLYTFGVKMKPSDTEDLFFLEHEGRAYVAMANDYVVFDKGRVFTVSEWLFEQLFQRK